MKTSFFRTLLVFVLAVALCGQDYPPPAGSNVVKEPAGAAPVAEKWERQADSLYRTGDVNASLALHEKVRKAYAESRQWEKAVKAGLKIFEHKLAGGYSIGDELPKMTSLLDISRRALPQMYSLQGECCNAIGQIYFNDNILDSAEHYFRLAVQLHERVQDWQNRGNAQTGLAACYYMLEQYKEMESVLRQAELVAAQHIPKDADFWGSLYNLYGALYSDLGRYEEALENSLREVAFYEQKNDKTNLSVAYNNIGDLYLSKGDFDRALEYFNAHLNIERGLQKTDAKNLALAYANLSRIWYWKKKYDQAIDFGVRAFDALKSLPPTAASEEYIRIYNDLAAARIEAGNHEEALQLLLKALSIHQSLKTDYAIEATWQNLGYAYRIAGDYAKAENCLHKAIAQYTSKYGPSHPGIGKAYRHLGFVAQRRGDLHEALRYQQEALKVLADSFDHKNVYANPALSGIRSNLDMLRTLSDKGRTLRQLAGTEPKPGVLEASLSAWQLAIDLLDSMRNEYQEGSVQFWNEDAHPVFEGAIEVAHQLFSRKKDQRFVELAFRFAEKSKAVLLAGALQESAAKRQAGIPAELLKREKALKIDIAFYQKQVFLEQQNGQEADAGKVLRWQSIILKQRKDYEKLLKRFETEFPAYYAAKYAGVVAVPELQRALGPGTVLLEYFYGEQNIYAFAVSRERIDFLSIEKTPGFPAGFEAFISGLRDRDLVLEQGRSAAALSSFARESAGYYNLLIEPLLPEVPEQLVVVPDGVLSYLPFDLLLIRAPDPDSATSYAALPYLLKSSAVRYEYSATIALHSAISVKPRRSYAGFAPDYGHETAATVRGGQISCNTMPERIFAPLTNNQTEIKAAAALFDGDAFLTRQATEARFRTEAGQYRVLHLAMHGFVNDCDPSYSGLVFSQLMRDTAVASAQGQSAAEENDGYLYAYEIYNIHLGAELAVLSACNTGLGQLARGEGIMSLARAFKYAGCPNILMSLWQADDKATAQIMERFYRHLKQGLNKDEAIRRAKLDYLSDANRNHPFFWGAFVLIGDDRPVEYDDGIAGIWLGLGAILLIFVAVWLFQRRRRFRKNT